MDDEELIEILNEFENKKPEKLKDKSKKLFYAIMKIADERDKYKAMYEMEKKLVVSYEFKIIELERKFKINEK